MHKYAQIIENKVTNVLVADESFVKAHPNDTFVLIEDVKPEPGIGWEYKDGKFIAPVIIQSMMFFKADQTTVALGTTITISAELVPTDDNNDANGKFFVPVIRSSDNKQGAFLMFEFVDGVASASLDLTESGHYIFDIGKIAPKPVSNVSSDISDIIIY